MSFRNWPEATGADGRTPFVALGRPPTEIVIQQVEDIQLFLDIAGVTRVTVPAGEWRTKPLLVRRSGATLHLAAGASLLAERGSLSSTANIIKLPRLADGRVARVTIEGEGPTSVIGFDDDEAYQGEHRHAIGVFNSDDVLIRTLRIQNTYGDGISVGTDDETAPLLRRSRRVVIENVEIDRASRNGVALVAAQDCVVRRVTITNVGPIAAGVAPTGPWAGIDVEPDESSQPMSCVLEDVTVDGCDGSGIKVELANAACDQDGYQMSLVVRRATVRNAGGAGLNVSNGFDYLHGSMTFEDCTVEGSGDAGIVVKDKALSGPSLSFARCSITGANQGAGEHENQAPIVVYKQTEDLEYPRWRVQDGGVTLDVAVTGNELPDRVWVAGRSDGFEVHNVTGTVTGEGGIHVEHATGVVLG